MQTDEDLALEVQPAGGHGETAREHWNPRQETMPLEQMRAYQTKKLKKQLVYLGERSTLYRDKFRASGFDPNALKSIEDLVNLPFTTKLELRDSQEAAPPFGTHQAAAMEEIIRITSTAGTTGKPVFQGYARGDVMRRNESIARGLWGFGVRPGDRVINGFALSMFNAGIPFCTGIEHLGAVDIPVGAERKTEGMLKMAREVKATVWIGTPSFAAYMAEKCEEVLGIHPSELGFKVVCGGGESGFEQPAFQKKMEQAWGTPYVFDWASTSDAHPNVFAHCKHRNGKHHLTPDFALVELIDPTTGKIIPMSEGAEGEYIFTHLDRRACPLARYRTGDILRVYTDPCPCGRTGFRMDIIGRADDMLIVRGVNLFPSAIQAVAGTFAPKTVGRLQIVLDKPGPKVEPPLRVRIEHAAGLGAAEVVELKAAIEKAIRAELTVTTAVEMLPPGGLGQTETKTKLVVVQS